MWISVYMVMTPGQGRVSVWRELVEAEIHICTRHPDSVRIVRAILLTRIHLRYLIAGTILTESGCLVQMYISASTSSLHTRTVPWPGVIPRHAEIYMAEG